MKIITIIISQYHIHMYITVIYIIYERSISFLTILKLFKISGLQTKTAFKQRFKYSKNEQINFIKVIL